VTNDKKRLGLAVPELLYINLKEKADYQGKTINATCLEIFWDYFDRKKKTVSEYDTRKERICPK